jgi:hypothetical protein
MPNMNWTWSSRCCLDCTYISPVSCWTTKIWLIVLDWEGLECCFGQQIRAVLRTSTLPQGTTPVSSVIKWRPFLTLTTCHWRAQRTWAQEKVWTYYGNHTAHLMKTSCGVEDIYVSLEEAAKV